MLSTLATWDQGFLKKVGHLIVSTWGPQTVKIIDLAQKICTCDVINLAIYLHCDIIKAPFVQT